MKSNSQQAAQEYNNLVEQYAQATERPMAQIRFENMAKILTDISAKISSSATIIDLGCGTGKSTELIRKIFVNAQIIGVDISAAEIKQAQLISQEKSLNINYQVGDIFEFDFPQNSVDLFISMMALHYFQEPSELEKLLKTIYQCLTDKGMFICQIVNPELELPYRDFGAEHFLENDNQSREEGTAYKVRLYAQPYRYFEQNWGQPLVEFTNYIHQKSTYEIAFHNAGFCFSSISLFIPEKLQTQFPHIDWNDLTKHPLYAMYILTKNLS